MSRTQLIAQARFAIEDILFAYAAGIDNGDLESLGALFSKGEVVMPDGRVLQGQEAVFNHYRSIMLFYSKKGKVKPYKRHKTTPRTRHINSNVRFKFDNAVQSAQVNSDFTAYQQVKKKVHIIAGGRYADQFERDIHGWYIARRIIHFDQQGDMSAHLSSL